MPPLDMTGHFQKLDTSYEIPVAAALLGRGQEPHRLPTSAQCGGKPSLLNAIGGHPPRFGSILAERRRNALATTDRELKLIAAPAMIGLRSTPKNG